MSPLAVRRYRAERLLRAEFGRLQARVMRVVARRLGAGGLALDERDLEACYALAWQGLYEAVLQGRQIANPAGWLVLVTYRRALDEHRARARAGHQREARDVDTPGRPSLGGAAVARGEEDFAELLEERELLRQLFEGLRARLNAAEREAAVLCYLHGLTRTEAARVMGISERGMDRLMDGRGAGHEGVSGKLGALVASIRDGRWCEQQGSLMRGLAFGILDPRGERYRLALAHSSECPACRAYVASLRGLAVALPPALLPGGLAAAILAHAAGTAVGAAGGAAGAAAGAGTSSGPGAGGQLAGGGALSGAGAAGAGAGGASSGWVLAGGPLGAKLAAGCLVAIGIGAGCVGLGVDGRARHTGGEPRAHAQRDRPVSGRPLQPLLTGSAATHAAEAGATPAADGGAGAAPIGEAARASREFGPEGGSGTPSGEGAGAAVARVASSNAPRTSSRASRRSARARREPTSASVSGDSGAATGSPQTPQPQREGGSAASVAQASSAEREFAPG